MRVNFFKKLKQFLSYFINSNTRKYFFVLLIRKIKKLFFKNQFQSEKNWLKKHTISHEDFYKINKIKYKNFFLKNKKKYYRALKAYKLVKIKMGGRADINLLYNVTKKIKPKAILETGVAFGWSTLAFCLSKEKKTKIISIDLPYPYKDSQNYVAGALTSEMKSSVKFYFGIDTSILKKLNKNKNKFDLIHYDSDKSFDGRKKNYEIIWNMLKKHGWFISDDVSDNSAFEHFIKKFEIKNFYILQFDKKFVGVAIKD